MSIKSAKYFIGDTLHGPVTASTAKNFSDIVKMFEVGVRINKTRAEFLALEKPERDRLKAVRYLVPACFRSSPSRRIFGEATVCNLLFLDVDDSADAAPFVKEPALLHKALWGFNFSAYQTANSTAEKPRIRIVVDADGLPKEKYAAAVETIGRLLGVKVNPESRNPTQPMFLPLLFKNTKEYGQ